MRNREEKMDKQGNMLLKVKRLLEQARSRVLCLRAVEVSDLREKIDMVTDEV